MWKLSRILPCLLLLALAACSGGPDDPEAEIRALVAEVKAAAEDRHTRRVMRHVSEHYRDDRGLDAEALRNMLRAQFLIHQSIHLFTRIQSIEFPTPVRARVVVLAGMAGSAAESADWARADLRADLYRFELTLEREDDGEWRLIRADWEAHRLGSGRGSGR
jgi:hypothetical protein